MNVTKQEKTQLLQQQALFNLKEYLEGGRFNGAKYFTCEPEGWFAAVGNPSVMVLPSGDYLISVINRRGSIRQWDNLDQIANFSKEFHHTRQLVLSAATYEEADADKIYSAYASDQLDLAPIVFLNELRLGNRLERHNGFDSEVTRVDTKLITSYFYWLIVKVKIRND